MLYKISFSVDHCVSQITLFHSLRSSDWVLSLLLKHFSRFFTTLDSADLLEQGPVHLGFLRIHKTAKLHLFLTFDARCAYTNCIDGSWLHLINQELLISLQFLLSKLILFLLLGILYVRSSNHIVHIRSVGPVLVLLLHTFLVDLVVKLLSQFFVLDTVLLFLLNSGDMSLLVFLDALFDVRFLLLFPKLFAIVTDNVSHPIHHSLNLLAALNDRLFSSLLLGDGDPHVFFHLFLIFLFTGLELSQSLLFVIQVVLNNFHCSLTILDLLGGFGFSIFL